jgi:hypothetical protein
MALLSIFTNTSSTPNKNHFKKLTTLAAVTHPFMTQNKNPFQKRFSCRAVFVCATLLLFATKAAFLT